MFSQVAENAMNGSDWTRVYPDSSQFEVGYDDQGPAAIRVKQHNAANLTRGMLMSAEIEGDKDFQKLADELIELTEPDTKPFLYLPYLSGEKEGVLQSQTVFMFMAEGKLVQISASNLFSKAEIKELRAEQAGDQESDVAEYLFPVLDKDEVRRRVAVFEGAVGKLGQAYDESAVLDRAKILTPEENAIYVNIRASRVRRLWGLDLAASSGKYVSINSSARKGNALLAEYGVSSLIRQWASTSNGDAPLSLALQQLIDENFNLKKASPWNFTGTTEEKEKLNLKVQDIIDKHRKILTNFLVRQYSTTQENLRKLGITDVRLYRGFGAYYGIMNSLGTDEADTSISMRPLTSFATDKTSADMFMADGKYEEGFGSGRITATVPASRIFSMPGSGFGCLEENEVVILGGSLQPDSIDMTLNIDPELTDMLQNFKRYDLMSLARKLVELNYNMELGSSPPTTEILRANRIKALFEASGNNLGISYRIPSGKIYDMLKKLYESGDFPGYEQFKDVLEDSFDLGQK